MCFGARAYQHVQDRRTRPAPRCFAAVSKKEASSIASGAHINKGRQIDYIKQRSTLREYAGMVSVPIAGKHELQR